LAPERSAGASVSGQPDGSSRRRRSLTAER